MLVYLGVSISINYLFAFIIRRFHIRRKGVMAMPIVVNVGLLLYFKYLNFAILNINYILNKSFQFRNIVLPLGISFYTFQQIAYIVSIENGELESNELIDYLAYILYFPKLVMGPIIDPVDFVLQINQSERKIANADNIASGIKLFSFGLFKKVLLADTFAKAVTWSFENIDKLTAMDSMLLVLFYSFEIYFDFSGYSDMATGVSSMINIDLPINFDSPYKAISIRDFWKRWHISLTKFLTKNIYIPLGGSKKGKLLTYLNVLIVFLVSGLWHGANWTFIVWGGAHGLLSCLDRAFERIEERVFLPVRWITTFFCTSILWMLFRAESITQWKNIMCKILLMQDTSVSEGLIMHFKIAESSFMINILHLDFFNNSIRGFAMLIFIFVAMSICFIPENNYRNKYKIGVSSMITAAIVFAWGVLCLGSESTFVYFGF
ncbi:MAG: MBOAT family protein [Lachnospiraceae bacterium]|nr:MBOAT family protein [Lachnospiraceae bacterium]